MPRASRAPRQRSKRPRSKRTAPAKASSSRRRPGGTRSTGAKRRARILELVRERSGITVLDVSKDIGVDPPPIYRVVRKLQAEGLVKKEGTSLHMAQ